MTRNGWVPIWRDGLCWQLWVAGEYRATVSFRQAGCVAYAVAYVPAKLSRTKRFRTFQDAARFVKTFTFEVSE